MKYQEKKLGRKRKGTFTKKVKGFKAKYNGNCMKCEEPVLEGQVVGWFSYGKVYHIEHLEEN